MLILIKGLCKTPISEKKPSLGCLPYTYLPLLIKKGRFAFKGSLAQNAGIRPCRQHSIMMLVWRSKIQKMLPVFRAIFPRLFSMGSHRNNIPDVRPHMIGCILGLISSDRIPAAEEWPARLYVVFTVQRMTTRWTVLAQPPSSTTWRLWCDMGVINMIGSRRLELV